ncbi:MAG TPA: tautomerase family protein, partial [Luteimonas sp.]|nr:tautomerase family protein [Luteimonas sp.]
MPIARIDLRRGKTPEYRRRVGQAVYDAMRSVGVPENDRFQVIQEHDADGLVYDP